MSDVTLLVERLRGAQSAELFHELNEMFDLLRLAADEIERLRAALRDIAADKYNDPASAAEVAKAALMASLPGIPGFPDGKGEA